MAATTRTCVIITCDVCQKPWKSASVNHWDSLTQAREAATNENWFIATDGTAICPTPYGWKHNNAAQELLPKLAERDRSELLTVRPWLNKKNAQSDETFPIVTLCGSMRFYKRLLEVAAQLTTAGQIVLMPHDASLTGIENKTLIEHGAMLDEMHRAKIRMSGSIYVVNVGGYTGESTRSEIAYATELGIPVQYDEPATAEAEG
jgi:hypothetical protein